MATAPLADPIASPNPYKPWAPVQGEKNLWYDRFFTYLMLGPNRSIERTYLERKVIEPKLKGERPSGEWNAKAVIFDWKERAAAYDQSQREADLKDEEQRRIDARERRRYMVDELTEATYTALVKADLAHLDQLGALYHLKTLQSLFLALITASRLEVGLPTSIQQNQELAFTADDLAKAQAKFPLFPGGGIGNFAAKQTDKRMLLLIAPRNLNMVLLTGGALDFTDIEPATGADFASELTSVRHEQGIGTLYLHIGPHTADQSLFLERETVDTAWLTGQIAGTKVLLLETHDGSAAPWEGLAEYLVTLESDLPANEAKTFTTTFWAAIGDGREVEQAYEEATATCSEQERGRIRKNW